MGISWKVLDSQVILTSCFQLVQEVAQSPKQVQAQNLYFKSFVINEFWRSICFMISGPQPNKLCIFPFFSNGLKWVGCQHRYMVYEDNEDKVCMSYFSLYYGPSKKRIVVSCSQSDLESFIFTVSAWFVRRKWMRTTISNQIIGVTVVLSVLTLITTLLIASGSRMTKH